MDRTYTQSVWARLMVRPCTAKSCVCAQALLHVWRVGRRTHYELRTGTGQRFSGHAANDHDAVLHGQRRLHEQGLERLRILPGPPVEVPRA